jgi:hypothetical protein
MMHRLATYVATVFLLSATSLVFAEDTTTRGYELPEHGRLELLVPQSWREEVHRPASGLPPTIVFTPGTGASFQILLTPLFSFRTDVVMPGIVEVKSIVEKTAKSVASQAVEETIPIKELKGDSVAGYYFTATDKAPKRGEYKYMTQGTFRVGDLAPTFTILTNDGGESAVIDGLAMLKGAKFMPRKVNQ